MEVQNIKRIRVPVKRPKYKRLVNRVLSMPMTWEQVDEVVEDAIRLAPKNPYGVCSEDLLDTDLSEWGFSQ